MADTQESMKPDTEEQYWQALDQCLSTECTTYERIDDSLRCWLYLATEFGDRFLPCDDDVVACSQRLLRSRLFRDNKEYVRTQIIYSLLQEDDAEPLHMIASFLLQDGRADDEIFKRMIDEMCFPRLLELINTVKKQDARLNRLLLELMYEMSRMERLRVADLLQIDDQFIEHLFQLIEGVSDDVADPYHYPTIRVLLVLNEQYMLASTDATVDPMSPTASLTNRVIKVLSLRGPSFRTFGENIILLLNRETETSLQLLILKVLYLLFTTKATYEYFYTNDLKVLLDIIIRNLMDLPDEKMSLRHTYLRVLYPLLAHTQLNQPPHYKRDEVARVLKILGGMGSAHFAPADETTIRLVDRVSKVKWLGEGDGSAEGEAVRRFLGISLCGSQTASSVSVVDVAAVMEKPGVQTPSRKAEFSAEEKGHDELAREVASTPLKAKKILPEVPKHRHGVPYTQSATLHLNGQKKVPPKAPPRRRTKLKAVEALVEPIEEQAM